MPEIHTCSECPKPISPLARTCSNAHKQKRHKRLRLERAYREGFEAGLKAAS